MRIHSLFRSSLARTATLFPLAALVALGTLVAGLEAKPSPAPATPPTRPAPAQQGPQETNQLVMVCHGTQGKPGQYRTILVAPESVAAHLAHGDILGSCDGFCIPAPSEEEGYKEKQDPNTKLIDLLQSNRVPSTLAGAFFRLAYAFLSGRPPETEIEATAFATLAELSATYPDLLECVVGRLGVLTPAQQMQLFGPVIAYPDSEPLTVPDLSSFVAAELIQRMSLSVFGELDPGICLQGERPGLARATTCFDVEGPFTGPCPRICRIKTPSMDEEIRTVGFVPPLTANELFLHEVEQVYSPDPNGMPLYETVVPPDCTGTSTAGVCLRVPDVERGDTVFLKGLNFFDVDAEVVLDLLPDLSLTRRVDAHVCGDVLTPASAPVDCGVEDILTFCIPDDLPDGLYRVGVVVPNNTGNPEFNRAFYGDDPGARPVIRVLPSQTTPFSITVEELHVVDETGSFNFTGSDELGLTLISVPILTDGSLGTMNRVQPDIIGDLDTGNRRSLMYSVFNGVAGTGLVFSMVGFEVDNKQAYVQGVTDFAEAYGIILESNWNVIGRTVGDLAAEFLGAIGLDKELGDALGEALAFAFNAVVAAWAPADLIIEDSAGISFPRIAELTSINFPNPPLVMSTSLGGIDVTVEPCQDTMEQNFEECPGAAKAPFQYTEKRTYKSSKEESTYKLTFKYTRVQ